jgi:hypothetical protein
VVVSVGLTDGFLKVEVNPAGLELQLKVLVSGSREMDPRMVLAPWQMALSSPATACGNGFTVTTTLLLFVHPVPVIVSVTV